MNWKKAENALVAETDYGRYTITRKEGPNRTFDISLDSGDALHELSGNHDSIAAATEAAAQDMAYREKMWNTL